MVKSTTGLGNCYNQYTEKDEKMAQEFKAGDWVKQPHWGEFYEISKVESNEILLKYGEAGSFCEWWYPLNKEFIKKEEPMKIDMSKKYRRVGTHEPVRIICTDRKVDDGLLPCVGLWLTEPHIEAMVYFNHEGVDPTGTKIIEEIPQTDWSKVQIDTPIVVIVQGHERRVHFAGLIGGNVCYYPDGRTSHSWGGVIAGSFGVYPSQAWLVYGTSHA